MRLPSTLENEIIDFLISLPNIRDDGGQKALIYETGLDAQLQEQISFGKPPAQFIPLLIDTMLAYGQLHDGHDPIEAVLIAAKRHVGRDKQDYCDLLLQKLHALPLEKNFLIIQRHDKARQGSLFNWRRLLVLAIFLLIPVGIIFIKSVFFTSVEVVQHTTDEAACFDIEGEIGELGKIFESYESRDQQGNRLIEKLRKVREEAPKLGKRLLEGIDDSKLRIVYQIGKYEQAAYAYFMAASAETDLQERTKFADRMIFAGEKCVSLIKEVRGQFKGSDDEKRKIIEWIEKGEKENVIHYVLAVAFAIKARQGNLSALQSVRDHLQEISPVYKEKNPPELEPDLKWFFDQEKNK